MFLVYVNNNVRDVVITHETFVKGGEKRVKNQKRREKKPMELMKTSRNRPETE